MHTRWHRQQSHEQRWHEQSASGLARSQRRAPSERRLLITGTPGTGKRVLGNYLVDSREFVHVDLDNPQARERFLGAGADGLRAELKANIEPGQDIVVTWTSASADDVATVRTMQALGFQWIWLDSDRGAIYQDAVSRRGRTRRGAALRRSLRRRRTIPRDRGRRLRDRRARACSQARTRTIRSCPAGTAPSVACGPGRSRASPAPRPRLGVRRSRCRRRSDRWADRLDATGRRQPALAASAGHALHARAAAQKRQPTLPRDGVLVGGRSLAGVKLGDSPAEVRALWGTHFTVCQGCGPTTWFYIIPNGDQPAGASVRFRNGKVTGIFTLGSPLGWHTTTGLRVGELFKTFNDPAPSVHWRSCNGYGAKVTATPSSVTSILTMGQAVYGFALTRPSESVCL